MMKSLCVFLVALSSFPLAYTNNDKIVGGSEVTPHAYPFTAAITLEGLCCCGGSIIGMRMRPPPVHPPPYNRQFRKCFKLFSRWEPRSDGRPLCRRIWMVWGDNRSTQPIWVGGHPATPDCPSDGRHRSWELQPLHNWQWHSYSEAQSAAGAQWGVTESKEHLLLRCITYISFLWNIVDWVQPINEAQLEPPVRDMVKAIGWGMVADDLPGNVDNLREVDVPVLSDTVAEAVYGGLDFETKV